jgi:hypothetical protein
MSRYLRLFALAAAIWIGAMLVFLAALLILGYFGVVLSAGLLAAWAGHTLASQRVCDDLELALMRAGVSDKEAAYAMGITPQQWTNQKAGDEMASLWRAAELPVAVWVEFAKLRLERFTNAVVVEKAEMAMLIEEVRELAARVKRDNERKVA